MKPMAGKATLLLRELLESHGVKCHEEAGWLRLTGTRQRAQAQLVHPPDSDTERTVQLDVRFEPWAGQLLVESCGGVGNTPEEAARDAFDNFARGALHVLLGAFVREPDEHVTVEELRVGGIPRRILLGDQLNRGPASTDETSVAWFDALEKALGTLPLATGTHWLRVYFAQMQERPMTLEVLLDNEPWPELRAALLDAPWPRAPEFLSVRLFLVIQGGADVSRAVAAFADPPGRDYDTLRDELRAHGATVLESEKLVAYVPEAFCQVLARSMGAHQFARSAFFSEPGVPGQHEVPLAQDPLWREAVRQAERAFAGQSLTRPQLEGVLFRSAMLNALNQALHKGSQPQDLAFAPLYIALSPEGMAELRTQGPRVRAEPAGPPKAPGSAPPSSAPEAPRRRWWKFW